MKVKDLLRCITEQTIENGNDVMDYDVYLEQCTESDKVFKRGEQKWGVINIKDNGIGQSTEYFDAAGFGGYAWKDYKVFVININY